ncbi:MULTISPECIES: phytanoyl-CoA dioxygenase family protein [unclassified Ruegeria]|uniref:phytanoyl-CoA dioxygenase family protein n=1 Tax=unclassified Ruegeria TaxID=2625375 RepID=UPI00149096F1|nr:MULTISPECIES: phytanoyl-CoA dioxygenase family protein [unclassified Ruegeria]NOD47847.1 phytanoyl-CoA dioxygenase [Ruegeria sp. HKCCD5849]NOD52831.1 phytanoyl-CoA dioxygenase [Ruegeria sp. HKCCD5851]NOD68977.1 phytanoyl-CoA dioxygenase [Ruegeria sp. HKCCD7303]
MVHQELGYVGYFDRESCDLDEFKVLTSQNLTADAVPHTASVEKNVPVYDMHALRPALERADERRSLLAEWARVLDKSAGVVVLKGAFADTSVIDRATDVFQQIIEEERQCAGGEGDHFAASGANDRIWNALQKQCFRDPEGFALYFGNVAIAAACEAWLGPNYQVTAQVNQVRPGGKAQQAHRDYHLGFQTAESAARYPAHAHLVTASLTLQGAVAHCDMPVESGPTKLLPFSQLYPPGYLAFHDAAHRAYFEENYIQLPLEKGDAVFFNPALFHAAGENSSADIQRMANLLQISSPFGRAMEMIDRHAMSLAVFSSLAALKQRGELGTAELDAAIAATAEGYPFPTNLDTDPPVGGNAPDSQADILHQAVSDGWTKAQLSDALSALQSRHAA